MSVVVATIVNTLGLPCPDVQTVPTGGRLAHSIVLTKPGGTVGLPVVWLEPDDETQAQVPVLVRELGPAGGSPVQVVPETPLVDGVTYYLAASDGRGRRPKSHLASDQTFRAATDQESPVTLQPSGDIRLVELVYPTVGHTGLRVPVLAVFELPGEGYEDQVVLISDSQAQDATLPLVVDGRTYVRVGLSRCEANLVIRTGDVEEISFVALHPATGTKTEIGTTSLTVPVLDASSE